MPLISLGMMAANSQSPRKAGGRIFFSLGLLPPLKNHSLTV
uniref:Alternative protein KPNA6 n=1 Tax=Homo sapiens TaxID=9606 RepID=L8E7Z7_HUMAN|nr:alternative protein KPNA6 [Homo sapiens]